MYCLMDNLQHYDRGNLYDNLQKDDFIEFVSPDNSFINPGREFYDSDEEYFVALLSAEFEGPRYVRPDPFGDKVELYEAPGLVVAVGEEIKLYDVGHNSNQVGQVFDRMMAGRGGNAVNEIENIDFEVSVEESVKKIFELL